MKVGILTFHRSYNFGAVLQCYALYETLKQINNDVYVIDYRPQYLSTPKPKLSIRTFINRHPYIAIHNYLFNKRRYELFEGFIKEHFNLTQTIFSYAEFIDLSKNFDYIFIGSDQVWNFKYNQGDEIWFGVEGKCNFVTYAASAGDAVFSKSELSFLLNRIDYFKAISLREKVLSDKLSAYKRKEYPVVLDPSLLANPTLWEKWYNTGIKGNYVVVYQGRQSDRLFEIAEKISKLYIDCVVVALDNMPNVKKLGYKPYAASPDSFVGIIKNARCVVTNSFHATVFSVICHRPFYCIEMDDGSDERNRSFLSLIGLDCRFIKNFSNNMQIDIDYRYSSQAIIRYRESSMNFIFKSLSQ